MKKNKITVYKGVRSFESKTVINITKTDVTKEHIKKGEKDQKNVVEAIQNYLNSSVSGSVEYVEVLSYPELEELRELHGRIILALAVKFSKARLIDNIIIDVDRLK